MTNMEKVIEDLNIAKYILASPQPLNREMCIKIGQTISAAIDLLKEHPVDMKVIGTFNGDIEVYCCQDCRTTLDPAFHYCPNCGRAVKWNETN